MILIADAHIQPEEQTAKRFFKMLEQLEKNDEPVIFLGDIFDLWIDLPRYESPAHRRFLQWCAVQKHRREVGFVEGNHEFFLARNHSSRFTWCTDSPFRADDRGNIFCHGDRINLRDRNYQLFRKLTKNPFTREIVRVLPMGPSIADRVKKNLKITNKRFRKYFPEKEILEFVRAHLTEAPARLFLGHFHRAWQRETPAGIRIYTLPAWAADEQITQVDEQSGSIRHENWRVLL